MRANGPDLPPGVAIRRQSGEENSEFVRRPVRTVRSAVRRSPGCLLIDAEAVDPPGAKVLTCRS